MALNLCERDNIVPVTDNNQIKIPVSLIETNYVLRCAQLQAAALAIESLEIVLPNFSDISDEEILEARYRLNDQLIPFRRAMYTLAPLVRSGLNTNASLTDIVQESRYVVNTSISPILNELRDKLDKERGKFWRKLLVKGGTTIPKFVLNWTTKGAITAAIQSLGDVKDIAIDIIERENILSTLKIHGGLGFLLDVAEYSGFKE